MTFKPQKLIPILGTPTLLVKGMTIKNSAAIRENIDLVCFILAYLVSNSMFKYCLQLLKK